MLSFHSLAELLVEAERSGVPLDEAALHEAIRSGRSPAFVSVTGPTQGPWLVPPGVLPGAPAGLAERWNGTGGWPVGLALPWCVLLAFVPGAPARFPSLVSGAYAVGSAASVSFRREIEAWLATDGMLGELAVLLPLMGAATLDSVRGVLRLEVQARRYLHESAAWPVPPTVAMHDVVSPEDLRPLRAPAVIEVATAASMPAEPILLAVPPETGPPPPAPPDIQAPLPVVDSGIRVPLPPVRSVVDDAAQLAANTTLPQGTRIEGLPDLPTAIVVSPEPLPPVEPPAARPSRSPRPLAPAPSVPTEAFTEASVRALLDFDDDALRRKAILVARESGELDAMERMAERLGDDAFARFLMDRASALRSDRSAVSERTDALHRAFALHTPLRWDAGWALAQELRLGNLGQEEAIVLQGLLELPAPADQTLTVLRRLGALLAFDLNQEAEAIAVYQEAVEAGQGDDGIVAELASWLMSAGREADVLELYHRCALQAEDPARARQFFHRMADVILVADIDPAMAKAWMSEAIDVVGRDIEFSRALVRLARAENDVLAELEHAESILSAGSVDPGATLTARVAELLASQGDMGRAEHYVREAVDRVDLSPAALQSLDRCLDEVALELGDPELAVAWWLRRAEMSDAPEHRWMCFAREAQARAASGEDAEGAVEAIDRALEAAMQAGVPADARSPLHLLAGRLKRKLNRFASAAYHVSHILPPAGTRPATTTPDGAVAVTLDEAATLQRVLRARDPRALHAFAGRAAERGLWDDAATAWEAAAECLAGTESAAFRAEVFAGLATAYERLQQDGGDA